MEQRLQEVIDGRQNSYVLPFFWQHGESKELLCEGMERIYESGIKEVCVESRTHPDFLGKGWWRDLDIIIAKADELGMKVWVLDDIHFPTGICNGMVTDDSPYGKIYLTHYGIDVVGPRKGLSFMVLLEPGEKLIGATLSRRDVNNPYHQTEFEDITDRVADGKVSADIPDGIWCVNIIKTTRKGTGRKNYINIIDRKAVKFFIDQIYEPHYNHYHEEFGKTFQGFFSDEPEIGNCGTEYGYDSNIGKPEMNLPWSDEVKEGLINIWGERFVCNLMSLWVETDEDSTNNQTGLLRAQFMDLITELYKENFCNQIGEWCRGHNVKYIGHIIEDDGAHAHLGRGTGHYFRALMGQDMAGIDVVLQQIRPQLDNIRFHGIGGVLGFHGTFFHYGLAKLGVSLAYMDPKKEGRTMCEVFGAYGWAEGLKLMKWLLNHMLVNGVNYFVPHAFTMKDFPDPDCPPHFYARGMNPQFPYFRYLMDYCGRICHLISGGNPVVHVAVLYTAEQEWMGEFTPFETVGMQLTRNQIDFAVLPTDYLLSVSVIDGEFSWGQEKIHTLIIPGSRCIRISFANWLIQAERAGLNVVFYGNIPYALMDNGRLIEYGLLAAKQNKEKSPAPFLCYTENLAKIIKEKEKTEEKVNTYEPWLRCYHYKQKNGEFRLFFNASEVDPIDNTWKLDDKVAHFTCWYNAWDNVLEPCEWEKGGCLKLSLAPGELKVLYCGAIGVDNEQLLKKESKRRESLKKCGIHVELDSDASTWKLWAKKAGEKSFELQNESELGDFSKKNPYFSGTMRYETVFQVPKCDACELNLGEVYETAHVIVNGKDAGVRVAPPYNFDIGQLIREGENTLKVEVVNTLVNQQRDRFSMTLPLEPSGLIGPVKLLYKGI